MFDAHTMQTVEERARVQVRGGYEPLEEIELGLIELVEHDPDTEDAFAADPEAGRDVVRAVLARHVEAHAREEAAFPAESDPDRLTAAFAVLDRDGIVARERVGYDQSDVRHEMWGLTTARPDARGWVAFHGQDLARVVDGLPLLLSFAHRSDRDEDFVLIGREVSDRLTAAGFTVEWNESADARIALIGVAWQRRRPDDDAEAAAPEAEPPDGPVAGGGLFSRAARRLRRNG